MATPGDQKEGFQTGKSVQPRLPRIHRQTRQPHRGGYDCEFVQRPPNFQTECSVCLLVLRSPHITSCCGNNFCKECIETIQKHGKSCPLCNAEQFILTHNRAHNVSLKQLDVYCSRRKLGCEWQGVLEMFDKHVDEGCPLQEVECEFKYAGCETKLPRKEMPEHLKDNLVGHMSLLARQNRELMAKLLEKDETIKRMVQENRREMEELKSHVAAETQHQFTELERSKASSVEVRGLKEESEKIHDRVLAVEKSAITCKAEREKLAQQVVTKAELEGCVRKLARKQDETKREVEKRISDLAKKQETAKAELHKRTGSLEEKQDATSNSLEKLHHHVQIVPVLPTSPVRIVMTNFEQHKRDSDLWYSEGFYTHPQGYKMDLCVLANGYGSAKDSHVSFFVYLMRGKFDDCLKWPIRGEFTIQLLNQREDKNHITKTFLVDNQTPAVYTARVTSGERCTNAIGYNILHSELGYDAATNCRYLMNDCLYFRVKVEIK